MTHVRSETEISHRCGGGLWLVGKIHDALVGFANTTEGTAAKNETKEEMIEIM